MAAAVWIERTRKRRIGIIAGDVKKTCRVAHHAKDLPRNDQRPGSRAAIGRELLDVTGRIPSGIPKDRPTTRVRATASCCGDIGVPSVIESEGHVHWAGKPTISESSSKEKSRPCWIEFHNKTRTIRRRASRGGRIRSPRRARKIYFAGGIELYRGHIARVLTGGHPKIRRPDDLPSGR